ncbi:hypothetical protein DOTSEDRAFT_27690 [Dothistroma septosporum NZE10]|uniref:Glycoside hydrolase family 16 protein n=1 Tax=Dothistroma septosporum (strain NZE10 / CBS 128990) TaxID=675120 RepID=N1PHU4_DOTSN|nr:hypothetical protein DOTSEDRAFT_27690 [Dothistroma septosporum NZE10]
MISLPIVTIFLLPFLTSTLAQIETASAGFYLLIDQPNSKHDNLSFLSISVSDGNRAITPNFISPSIDKSITPVFHLNTTGSDTNSGFLNLENHDNESNYIGTAKKSALQENHSSDPLLTASVPLAFSLDPTSNVATALFSTAFLSSYLFIPEVYFDESGHLGIRTNYDDTVNPPDYSNYTTYYKW